MFLNQRGLKKKGQLRETWKEGEVRISAARGVQQSLGRLVLQLKMETGNLSQVLRRKVI